MNTRQLKCVIEADSEMKNIIIGVYAADELPGRQTSIPYGLIVNTDPHWSPGKHWIAFYITDHSVRMFSFVWEFAEYLFIIHQTLHKHI
jgi:hypothetical protein